MKQEDKTLMMLVGDVHRQFGHRIRELEKRNGLGMCSNCILFELDRNGSLTQVELVEKIHMRPSSVSVALQKMEADELIKRTVKDDDQRYTIVSLTDKGKTFCKEMRKRIRDLDESVTKEINQEELEIAKKVLKELSLAFMEEYNENI